MKSREYKKIILMIKIKNKNRIVIFLFCIYLSDQRIGKTAIHYGIGYGDENSDYADNPEFRGREQLRKDESDEEGYA